MILLRNKHDIVQYYNQIFHPKTNIFKYLEFFLLYAELHWSTVLFFDPIHFNSFKYFTISSLYFAQRKSHIFVMTRKWKHDRLFNFEWTTLIIFVRMYSFFVLITLGLCG